SNYDSNLTYTISPVGAAIDASGEISGDAGTYTVTVESGDGCQASAEVTIEEQLDVPTISVVGTDPTSCGGEGEITFTFTNVNDGTYDIGGFDDVVVSA